MAGSVTSLWITCRNWYRRNWQSRQQCAFWSVVWLQWLLIPALSVLCSALHSQLKMLIIKLLWSTSWWYAIQHAFIHSIAIIILSVRLLSVCPFVHLCTARLFSQGVDLFALRFYLDRVIPINHSWRQKTRDTGLPDGENRIPLRSLILTQNRSVLNLLPANRYFGFTGICQIRASQFSGLTGWEG